MQSRALLMLLTPAVLASSGCVVSRQPVSVTGRAVQVFPATRTHGQLVAGELLAVDAESVWVAQSGQIVTVPLVNVAEVELRRTSLKGIDALVYSVGGGLVTGGALAAACAQVEGADCSTVFPIVLLTWLLGGSVAAASVEGSARLRFAPGQWADLRPYARFPQGLPAGASRDSVLAPELR